MSKSTMHNQPMHKLLLGYAFMFTVLTGMSVFFLTESVDTFHKIVTINETSPSVWTFSTGDIISIIILPPLLWGPVAAFPSQWCKSADASHRRQVIFAFMVIIFLMSGIVVRFTTGYVLDAWLHPKGYVECKLDPKKRWNYSRKFLYGLGPENCEFGVIGYDTEEIHSRHTKKYSFADF